MFWYNSASHVFPITCTLNCCTYYRILSYRKVYFIINISGFAWSIKYVSVTFVVGVQNHPLYNDTVAIRIITSAGKGHKWFVCARHNGNEPSALQLELKRKLILRPPKAVTFWLYYSLEYKLIRLVRKVYYFNTTSLYRRIWIAVNYNIGVLILIKYLYCHIR